MLDRDLTRKEEETARRLLSYLLRHPEARDTLEGMTRWWLLEEEIHERLVEISQGLSSLVKQGLILEEHRGASLPLYRLNPDKKDEVKALVERLFPPSKGGLEMPMNITNRSKQLLVIPLNSGATLHLAPGEEAGGSIRSKPKTIQPLRKWRSGDGCRWPKRTKPPRRSGEGVEDRSLGTIHMNRGFPRAGISHREG
ncbi:MAG: hypothetical protein MPW14_13615 [Candidatus Manganitrophus sp.]|nr:MAG: hypothetical protein MPW14_13615 [Candidatus Manganitrophus sp.]